jgi:hypothetical protein
MFVKRLIKKWKGNSGLEPVASFGPAWQPPVTINTPSPEWQTEMET